MTPATRGEGDPPQGDPPQPPVRPAPWTPSVVALLREWAARCAASTETHYGMAGRLSSYNLWLGVPVVVLATFVGTSVFATIQEKVDTKLRIIVGGISVLAAVLASLQTFLRFAERAEQHRVAAEKWASIRREIDELLRLYPSYPPASGDDPQKYLHELRKRMDGVATESPQMAERAWLRAQRKYGLAASRSRRRRRRTIPTAPAGTGSR